MDLDVSDSMFVGAVLLGVILALVGISLLYTMLAAEPGPVDAPVTEKYRTDVQGNPYLVAEQALKTVCLSANCPPAVSTQQFEPSAQADWLSPADQVIGVTIDGEAYAFPIQILRWHPVVNTYVERRPLAVTYDPYTGHPAVYDRFIGGEARDLKPSGKLYRGSMVLADDTESLWTQYTGKAIRGRFTGEVLDEESSEMVRWSLWSKQHPETNVLSRPDAVYNISQYRDDPYSTYRRSDRIPVDGFTDGRLGRKDPIIGVKANNSSLAIREVLIKDQELVQGVVGDIPVAAVQNDNTGTIRVFDRRVENTTRFFVWEENKLFDLKTDETFWPNGTVYRGDGRIGGEPLETVPYTRSYWFAWASFYPETAVYQP